MTRKPDLHDYDKFPGMVGWFDPRVLAKTARKHLDSVLFGKYADRRLIHAALDPIDPPDITERYDLRKQIEPLNDAVWVDYVADLGDGFDSTYAIAYLLGQKSITIPDHGNLPRGQCLIMGGDQVYPDATVDDYNSRLRTPNKYAFPNSDAKGAAHPPVFLIPGNHDWYDGLTLFLGLFCRGRTTKLGSWRATQHRSYFALQLPNNWWIWGYDSQLGEDIDQPQANYFVNVARSMSDSPKVILCAPTPTWLKADINATDDKERAKFNRALDYVAYDILNKQCPDASVCAVLSGDLHHYSRYAAEIAGTQFITAGGGGAFLHPTHHLKDEFTARWVRQKQKLSLKTEPGPNHEPCNQEACYPHRDKSRKLAIGNLKFALANPQFCFALGAVYWVVAQLLMFSRNNVFERTEVAGWQWAGDIAWSLFTAPMFWALTALLMAALYQYADAKSKKVRLLLAVAHGVWHAALILALLSLLPPLNLFVTQLIGLDPLRPGTILHAIVSFAEIMASGFIGGFVWGIYLLLVSFIAGLHSNDAFSAMRLGTHKHFLRMKIMENQLTIYPVGIDDVPTRDDWSVNWPNDLNDQDKPMVSPKEPLPVHLIEGPVVIQLPSVQPIQEAAKAS